MGRINRALCLEAMDDLIIAGEVSSPVREAAIASAIASIQKDGGVKLRSEYVGVKNYASFGDQREDHKYGYGPRHGSIVFQIEMTSGARVNSVVLGPKHIYLLECVRDAGSFAPVSLDPFVRNARSRALNLYEVLSRCWKMNRVIGYYHQEISERSVDPQGGVPEFEKEKDDE